MNRTTFESTPRQLRSVRLAFVLVAFVALLALVANAVAAGMTGVLLGALGLAVGVTLVTALPFLLVRSVSDAALR